MSTTLEQFVSVRGRFHRSVSLAADWGMDEPLREYLATDTVVELAGGILEELDSRLGARAWSITGPYGSGKSAFGLFLCEVLAKARSAHPAAGALRRLHRMGVRRFLPVLVSAERGPLAPVLARALHPSGRTAGKSSPQLDGARVVAALEQAVVRARRRRCSGLVLVVDELGKFLEYAALHPQDADVFLLQQVAEAATRSAVPIVLLTILHSGFADYLPATEEVRRAEWQKVQGRYRDVPFQLPPDQVLQLVASALDSRLPTSLASRWRTELDAVVTRLLERRGGKCLSRVLERCLPLHPITALLLWPLFRSKGAQNERSLFAFLTSREPYGLREYLSATPADSASAQMFRPAHLFDYIATCLGLGAFRGDHARRWALADQALTRLSAESPRACADVIKTVALLSLYGDQVGLRASPQAIALAVGDAAEAKNACEHLTSTSLLVFRKHSGSFALWEGSDFDLESAHESARLRIRGAGSLAQRLERALRVPALVPRAHYVRKGTLRWFEVDLVSSAEELATALDRQSSADGRAAFVLASPDSLTSAEELEALVRKRVDTGRPVVLVFPRDLAGIESALDDLEAWQWVASYSPELASDAVARQEVRARVSAARDHLESIIGPVLGLAGLSIDPSRSRWICDGSVAKIDTALALQKWLTSVCDRLFHLAPVLNNELLNRSVLSSASAAGRRTLIEHMLQQGSTPRLGIEGWPPEAAMYESMLSESGIHQERDSGWVFDRPKGAWAPAWDACLGFVRSAQSNRRPISELFQTLRAPPYGLKDGPLPVLLAAILLAMGDEVALYEDALFVPDLRIEVFERLLRRPESFDIRCHEFSGVQMKMVRTLRRALAEAAVAQPAGSDSGSAVELVRRLVVSAAGMPPYARQTRRRLSPEAVRVREQLMGATDPAKLLFEDLPTACGVELHARSVDRFVDALTECMKEITSAYRSLLDEIEAAVRNAFGLASEPGLAERQLRQIAQPLLAVASDPRLQVFLRVAIQEQGGRDWREAIGRAVNDGLPPTHWRDADVASFQVRLSELRGDISRLGALAQEMRVTGAPRVVRLSVLEGAGAEVNEVIALRDGTDAEVEGLVRGIVSALWQSAEDSADARTVRLEALGRVAADLLSGTRKEAER